MEELRDSSIHHTALKFCEDVKQMKIYNNLYKTVQVDILNSRKCSGNATHKFFYFLLSETSMLTGCM